jgi:hypothetical protein
MFINGYPSANRYQYNEPHTKVLSMSKEQHMTAVSTGCDITDTHFQSANNLSEHL